MNLPREQFAGTGLSVLVIDGGAAGRSGPSRLLAELGHEPTRADGEAAIERLRCAAPDLILVALPGSPAEGLRIAERIRGLPHCASTPIVHLAPEAIDADIARAIRASGDDLLPEEAVDRLAPRLRDLACIAQLRRENERQRAELERYSNEVEEEQRTASGLMHRLVQMDGICDPTVRYRFTPAQHLSGDVIAAARTPGDCLQVLVADGTGHGLAASLGVMPVVQPFYAMTQKGFGLATIAKEINRKVREWLPVGRFVAASLIEIDPHARMVSVWNGGNPPLVLLGDDGRELYRFVSRQLPLGIVCSRDMELSVERFTLEGAAQLIACSDGVVEAMDPLGNAFGIGRLIAVAGGAARGARLEAISDALDEHLAGRKPHDDLSLVLVDCAASPGPQDEADLAAGGASRALRSWRFDAELCPEELRQTDVVPLLIATLERMNLPPVHRSNLFVVLSELFNNALDHGVLLLDSRLKVGGMERYLALRAKRLATLTEGWVRVELAMIEREGEACLRIRVCDSGEGFDWQRTQGSVEQAALHGRGLALVRRLCASVDFRGTGSDVVAIYRIGSR